MEQENIARLLSSAPEIGVQESFCRLPPQGLSSFPCIPRRQYNNDCGDNNDIKHKTHTHTHTHLLSTPKMQPVQTGQSNQHHRRTKSDIDGSEDGKTQNKTPQNQRGSDRTTQPLSRPHRGPLPLTASSSSCPPSQPLLRLHRRRRHHPQKQKHRQKTRWRQRRATRTTAKPTARTC